MTIIETLRSSFGEQVSLEEIEPNAFRIYTPFFHEDGDMYSMYLSIKADGTMRLQDYGNTLMRVSYTFDIDTPNKQRTIASIVSSNFGTLEDGEICIPTTIDNLVHSIFQFSQIVSKVSNIDILRHSIVKSMFYEYLNSFITTEFATFGVVQNTKPTKDNTLIVDYTIPQKKPIYIFGVNDNTKASKVVISCLNFQTKNLPFRSVIVHEDFDNLSKFNRRQITNAADKQFSLFEDFKANGFAYIQRESAS